jgi:hypothetical protein
MHTVSSKRRQVEQNKGQEGDEGDLNMSTTSLNTTTDPSSDPHQLLKEKRRTGRGKTGLNSRNHRTRSEKMELEKKLFGEFGSGDENHQNDEKYEHFDFFIKKSRPKFNQARTTPPLHGLQICQPASSVWLTFSITSHAKWVMMIVMKTMVMWFKTARARVVPAKLTQQPKAAKMTGKRPRKRQPLPRNPPKQPSPLLASLPVSHAHQLDC